MTKIHPSSIVDPKAELAKDVEVGPFCTIGPKVQIGPGTRLISHNVIDGDTQIGSGNVLYPFASLGLPCQHKRNKSDDTKLVVGDDNIFREHFTAHTGSDVDNKITKIGSRNWFLVGSHVAHDCIVGNDIVMSNNAGLAGHVIVQDKAIIGAMSGVLQFTHIGEGAMIGGMVGVARDVIPFGIVMHNSLNGLNLVGLQRAGTDKALITELQAAYKTLFMDQKGLFSERLAAIATTYSENLLVQKIVAFCQEPSKNGILRPERNA
ncbi:MAG: acyl-ACP--UDP-N-acetylglucosamine O-acyltransferase [Alphaproteobacteria bacterium]|nr:acyl-ACP--UDP-N-acetylglucosamine O-acyltransferase [Alphaproteobacteria bacterium]